MIDLSEIRNNSKNNPGYVYLIKNNSGSYKIGITINLERRIKTFQTANDNKLVLIDFTVVKDRILVEKTLHSKLKYKRLSGEWFQLTDIEVETIRTIFKELYTYF